MFCDSGKNKIVENRKLENRWEKTSGFLATNNKNIRPKNNIKIAILLTFLIHLIVELKFFSRQQYKNK